MMMDYERCQRHGAVPVNHVGALGAAAIWCRWCRWCCAGACRCAAERCAALVAQGARQHLRMIALTSTVADGAARCAGCVGWCCCRRRFRLRTVTVTTGAAAVGGCCADCRQRCWCASARNAERCCRLRALLERCRCWLTLVNAGCRQQIAAVVVVAGAAVVVDGKRPPPRRCTVAPPRRRQRAPCRRRAGAIDCWCRRNTVTPSTVG